jgi:N-acetylneuraminate lyase
MLLAALALGAKGAIGSTYNFAGLLYGGLLEAFDGGDLVRARRLQAKAVEIIDAISATACGYLPAAKAIVKMLGLDLGPVRSPLRDITVEEEKALRARLERIGFFEYACKL